MKTTTREKPAIRQTAKSNGARRAPAMKPRDEQASRKAAADCQIAEIERTFTIQYEW